MEPKFLLKSHAVFPKGKINTSRIHRMQKKWILLHLLIFCLLSVSNAQVNLNDGLVAFLPFNGNANDVSGNGNNGIINGATLTNGRFGNPDAAYSFDGQNDYIKVPHAQILNLSSSISLSIWIQYNEGVASTYEDIVMKGNNTYGFQFSSSGGQIMFHIRSGGWRNLNSQVVPEKNKWYHIVGTYDGTTQKIYINGELKAKATWSGKIETSSDPLYFGYVVAGDNNWYNGILSDFRLYNRAISEEEITELFHETAIEGIYSISPKSVGTSENSSDISIYAYPITTESKIELVNGENTITPDSILERNTYSIKARFSFKNKTLGIYDALLISDNDTMRLEKCFSLVLRSEALEPTDTDNDGLRNILEFGHIVWISQHSESWSWSYEIDNDIEADETKNWNEGKGLNPITEFSGIIDGQGHKIKYFQMSRSDEENVAFIGQLSSNGIIRNLGLTNCNIKGKNYVSSFVGKNNGGSISNCYASGSISGNNYVGGITGYNSGTIKFCYNSSLINGVENIGGLAGSSNSSSTISQSYNIGKVIGSDLNVGGIIGANSGTIKNCYNAGSVIGAGEVAGISGRNYGSISFTYNRGYVNGTGGYCGAINGYGSGSITNSYWDKENSGLTTSNGGTGKTAAEMKSQSAYPNWDFTDTWEILSTLNDGYPQLTWAKTTSLIKSYSPERVANSGSATITFEGINFDSNTNVCLYKAGQDTLKADTIYTSDTYCSAQFNFNNTSLGAWNILVEYPDTMVTIKNGLTVEETKTGKLDIEILGPDVFRKGRTTTFTIRVKNTGNTTISNPTIAVALDSEDSTFSLSCNSSIDEKVRENCEKVKLNINKLNFIKSDNVLGHNDRLCKLGLFLFPTLYSYSSAELVVNVNSTGDLSIAAWENPTTVEEINEILQKEINSSQLKSENISSINYGCAGQIASCLTAIACTRITNLSASLVTSTVSSIAITATTNNTPAGWTQTISAGLITAGVLAEVTGVATVGTGVLLAGAVTLAVLDGLSCYNIANKCPRPFPSTQIDVTAVGSFDPNDKYGYRSPTGSKYFNEDKTNFTYVIDFENKETASASAQEVFVTDSLDLNVFDIASFKAGSIKIGENTYDASFNARDAKWTIDMRPAMNYITYVTLKLDTATGVAQWYFKSVDPVTLDWPTDPTAGFLPPNDSIGRGQGSVSFSIDLKNGLSDEATLNNKATIVFDTNDPIKTPTWTNKKDVVAPTSSMSDPEIVADNLAHLVWEGTDNKNGAGVYCFNVYVKKDNGEYEPYLSRTTTTSTDFEYDPNSGYSFYVTAIDSAENVEVKTNVPDVALYKTDVKTLPLVQDKVVNIVPNPNNGTFTVNTTFEGKSQLTITTLSGQRIYGPVSFNQTTQVNLTGQSKGVYICVVKNSNQFKTQKMEIQ
jgi:hypothetical protein